MRQSHQIILEEGLNKVNCNILKTSASMKDNMPYSLDKRTNDLQFATNYVNLTLLLIFPFLSFPKFTSPRIIIKYLQQVQIKMSFNQYRGSKTSEIEMPRNSGTMYSFIEHREQQIKHVTRLNKDLQTSNADLRLQLNKDRNQIANLDKEVQQLNIRLEDLRKTDENLQAEISKQEQYLNRLNQQLTQKNRQIKIQQTRQSQQRKSNQAQMQSQIKRLMVEIQKQKFQISQLRERESKLRDSKKQLQLKLKQRQDEIARLIRQKEQVQSESKKFQRQIDQLRKQMYQLIEQDKVKRMELQKETTELIKQQRQIERLNQLKMEAKEKYKKQEERNKNKTKISGANRAVSHYFNGDVLDGEDDYKDYLLEIIEQRAGRRIKNTKLIYRYDELNKVNFHKYIDNNEQLVIVIKLANKYMLGAWTQGSFYPKMVSDRDGLIFSLTNKKTFELRERNKRAIAYDDFFLIIGNSEVRLKSQDKKLFSNFAISNGYYENKGEKVDILLGSGTVREVEMETFEVFQLKFN